MRFMFVKNFILHRHRNKWKDFHIIHSLSLSLSLGGEQKFPFPRHTLPGEVIKMSNNFWFSYMNSVNVCFYRIFCAFDWTKIYQITMARTIWTYKRSWRKGEVSVLFQREDHMNLLFDTNDEGDKSGSFV